MRWEWWEPTDYLPRSFERQTYWTHENLVFEVSSRQAAFCNTSRSAYINLQAKRFGLWQRCKYTNVWSICLGKARFCFFLVYFRRREHFIFVKVLKSKQLKRFGVFLIRYFLHASHIVYNGIVSFFFRNKIRARCHEFNIEKLHWSISGMFNRISLSIRIWKTHDQARTRALDDILFCWNRQKKLFKQIFSSNFLLYMFTTIKKPPSKFDRY